MTKGTLERMFLLNLFLSRLRRKDNPTSPDPKVDFCKSCCKVFRGFIDWYNTPFIKAYLGPEGIVITIWCQRCKKFNPKGYFLNQTTQSLCKQEMSLLDYTLWMRIPQECLIGTFSSYIRKTHTDMWCNDLVDTEGLKRLPRPYVGIQDKEEDFSITSRWPGLWRKEVVRNFQLARDRLEMAQSKFHSPRSTVWARLKPLNDRPQCNRCKVPYSYIPGIRYEFALVGKKNDLLEIQCRRCRHMKKIKQLKI